jgi:hypothetical protein
MRGIIRARAHILLGAKYNDMRDGSMQTDSFVQYGPRVINSLSSVPHSCAWSCSMGSTLGKC